MNTIDTVDPRMQLVYWRERQYYTSHYFHQWYLVNSASEKGKAKYRRHEHFIRRIKTIESYPLFVERGDIVLLTSKTLHPEMGYLNETKELRALLATNNFHVVYLISAAFQVELAHHLDTAQDREIAYRHSKTTAERREALGPESLLKMAAEVAAHVMGQYFPVLLDARITPLEHGQAHLVGRVDQLEHAAVEDYKSLVHKYAHLEAEYAHLKEEIALLKAPDGWRTVLEYMRELRGEQRDAVIDCLTNTYRRWDYVKQFEYFCMVELRKQGVDPRTYKNGNRQDYFFPYDVFTQGLEDYMKWRQENRDILSRKIPLPKNYQLHKEAS